MVPLSPWPPTQPNILCAPWAQKMIPRARRRIVRDHDGEVAKTKSMQQSLQIPPTLTLLAAFTECFGGLAVVVGLLTRPAALRLCRVTIVAMTKGHLPHGFFIHWSLQAGKGHGYEMDLAFLAVALAVLVGGAGALSIDRLIAPS